jgi:hypothetical protein
MNKHVKQNKEKHNVAMDEKKKKMDKELDKKLKDTFPASDSTANY